jgi:hypothetical protein
MSDWSLVSAAVTLSGYSAALFRPLYPVFRDTVMASAPSNVTLIAVDITSVTELTNASIVVVFSVAVLNQVLAASLVDALAAALTAAFQARLTANLAAAGRPATNVTVTTAPHVVSTSSAPRSAPVSGIVALALGLLAAAAYACA